MYLVFSNETLPQYDTIKLALKWHRSECCKVDPANITNPDCSTCNANEIEAEWRIHGLWADDSSGRIIDARNCHNPIRRIKFDWYSNQLLKKMKRYWSPNREGTAHGDFWWVQWSKHGLCLRDVLEKHLDYFRKAIELYELYDVKEILKQGSVIRGGAYSRTRMDKVLKYSFHKRPKITCSVRSFFLIFEAHIYFLFGISVTISRMFNFQAQNGSDKTYLHGIQLCFTKQFELKDCNFGTNCKAPTYYP